MIPSPQAIALAKKVHARAVRRRGEAEKALPTKHLQDEVERLEKLVGEQQEIIRSYYRIVAVVRIMVRRWLADRYTGRVDHWKDLVRQIEVLDRCK